MKTLIALIAVGLLTGCSTITQRASTATTGTNEVRTTELTVRTVFDAKNVVGALRASNGKTHSLGAIDVEQESTSAGSVDLVKSLTELVGAVKTPLPIPLPAAKPTP